MANIKGSAVGTLTGQDVRPTEMERLAAEGASTAQALLKAYSSTPTYVGPDVEKAFAPLVSDIQNSPNPEPLPLPDAPTGARLALGLIGNSLAGRFNAPVSQEILKTTIDKLNNREAVGRANVAQQNQANADRQAQFLALREKILSTKMQQELEAGRAAQADKTQKELFVVQSAMDHIKTALDQKFEMQKTAAQIAGEERVAKMNGLFQFLSQLPRDLVAGDKAGGGMTADQESQEINKLVDFTDQIDMKFQPDKGILGFGAKKPSDEEMSGFMRTFSAYLSSPSQRVRQTSLYFLQSALQDRFGDNAQKKLDFLQKYGLAVIAPAAQTPPATPPAPAAPAQTPAAVTPPASSTAGSAPVDTSQPFISPSAPRAVVTPSSTPEARKLLRENLGR